jgi:hypothetical protein
MKISNLDLKTNFAREVVKAPELQEDGELIIQELSGADQMQLMSEMQAGKRPTDIDLAALLFHRSIISEDGARLLPDIDAAKKFIDAIPARLFNRLHRAIWDLNNGEVEKKV